jgi:hypothetical protein
MKFGQVAPFILSAAVWAFAQASLFAQDCPLDNAFLFGQKAGTINPSRMETLAGLAASRINSGVLWAHDAGAIKQIFAISTTGKAIDDYTFDRTLTDAEDIAVGPGPTAGSQYIYLADCGGARSTITIARFPEPAVDLDPHTPGNIPLANQAYFALSYPDGAHNARAIMVDPISSDLFVITYEDTTANVYRSVQLSPSMTLVGTVPLAGVTAADISPDGSEIIMRSASAALRWTRGVGETIQQALAFTPHSIPILGTIEINGDSIAFAADASGYFTTSQAQNPPLLFFQRNTTRYTKGVTLGTLQDDTMLEISGIAASRQNPGLAWIHNDGPQTSLWLVSTNGAIFGVYQFAQPTTDFEDIAIGPGPVAGVDYVYGGDIGDNNSVRTEVHLFRFPEPRVTQSSSAPIAAGEQVITLVYPDGAHDAEALMIDPISGDAFIAIKETGVFHLYKATQAQLNSGGGVQLALVQAGAFGPVSGGDISPDGTQIVLRHENDARLWHRNPGESVEAALGRDGEKIPVIGIPLEPNGEGISFASDSKSYYTISEGLFPIIYFFQPLAQPFFAKPIEMAANGIRATVSGCDGSRVRLEASSDLINWSTAAFGDVVNGVATIEAPATDRAMFYRALVDGP